MFVFLYPAEETLFYVSSAGFTGYLMLCLIPKSGRKLTFADLWIVFLTLKRVRKYANIDLRIDLSILVLPHES